MRVRACVMRSRGPHDSLAFRITTTAGHRPPTPRWGWKAWCSTLIGRASAGGAGWNILLY
jgi:hypothetical protein